MKNALFVLSLSGLIISCSKGGSTFSSPVHSKNIESESVSVPVTEPKNQTAEAIRQWQKGICDGKAVFNFFDALKLGVFSDLEVEAIKDCNPPFLTQPPSELTRVQNFARRLARREEYTVATIETITPGQMRLAQGILADKDFLNIVDETGATPLIALVKANEVDLIQFVLETKLLVSQLVIPDSFGRIPFHYAQSKNAAMIFWNVSSSLKWFQTKDDQGQNAFLFMAQNVNAIEAFRYLTKQVCDGRFKRIKNQLMGYSNFRNALDNKNQSALHKAVLSGNTQALQLLTSCKGVDYDQQDIHGRTALHYAAAIVDPKSTAAVLLLNHPFEIDMSLVDESGFTSLHYATVCHNPVAAKSLFQAGAKPAVSFNHPVDRSKRSVDCPNFQDAQ